ncbi:MAG: hydrolase [Parcubacteria group bacterium]|nr:hydrolase [Parcubacteria group bacterium]
MNKRPLPPGVTFHSDTAEKVFDGVRFDVHQWKQKQFNGEMHTFETVRRTDNVIVLPIIGDEIVAVREQQPHWDAPALNIVAGMLEDGEDILAGAKRELEEETGMVFTNFYLVHMEQPNPSAEWISYTVVAAGFTGETKDQHLDAGETSEPVRMSIDDYIATVRKFGFKYRQRFAEDCLIQEREAELRTILKDPAPHELT